MILTGGPNGGDLLTSLVAPGVLRYDPVYGAELLPDYFWRLLPDSYRLLGDREQIEVLWRGLMLLTARELHSLYQVDAAKSLQTFPPEWQRKWVDIRLIQEVDFRTDPAFPVRSNRFTHDPDTAQLDGVWVTQASLSRSALRLRGPVSEEFTLRWGFSFRLGTTIPVGSLLYVGYLSEESAGLENSLLVGVGLGNGDNQGAMVLVHFPPLGPPSFIRSVPFLDPETDYLVRAHYLGDDRRVRAVVWRLDEGTPLEKVAELSLDLLQSGPGGSFTVDLFGTTNFDVSSDERVLTGDGGTVDDGDGDGTTPYFDDLSADFQSSGVREGDVVRITAHSPSLELEILGVLSETRLLLAVEISDGILTSSYRLRSPTHILDSGELVYEGTRYAPVSLEGSLTDWTYLDPYVDARALQIPRLTNAVVEPQLVLEGGRDFEVSAGGLKFGQVPVEVLEGVGGADGPDSPYFEDLLAQFTDRVVARESLLWAGGAEYLVAEVLSDTRLRCVPAFPAALVGEVPYRIETPAGRLWAEYATFDDGVLADNFGHMVQLPEVGSTAEDLARVRGLFYSLFRGGTVENIRRGAHILLGLPISVRAGSVTAVNPVYSGQQGLLTVHGDDGVDRSHLYPLVLGTHLEVGDSVGAFEPLTPGVRVVDYRSHPDWWLFSPQYSLISELQKFHTFSVEVDTRAFLEGFEVVRTISSFVDRIAPSFKRHYIEARHSLVDDQDRASDALSFVLASAFEDAAYGDVVIPYVGARRTPPSFDYSVGQGWSTAVVPAGVYVPASMTRPRLVVGRYELDHPDDPLTYLLTDVTGATVTSAPTNTGSFPDDVDGDTRTQTFEDPNATFQTSLVGPDDVLEIAADPSQRYIIDSVTSETILRVQAEVPLHAATDLNWVIYLDTTTVLVA